MRRITTILPKANATEVLLSDERQLKLLRGLAKDAGVEMNRHGLLDNKGASRAASASVSVSVESESAGVCRLAEVRVAAMGAFHVDHDVWATTCVYSPMHVESVHSAATCNAQISCPTVV